MKNFFIFSFLFLITFSVFGSNYSITYIDNTFKSENLRLCNISYCADVYNNASAVNLISIDVNYIYEISEMDNFVLQDFLFSNFQNIVFGIILIVSLITIIFIVFRKR